MAFGQDIVMKLGLDSRQFSRGLRSAQRSVTAIGSSLSGLGGIVGAGSLAAVSAKVLQFADDLQTAADTIGVTTKELQEFRFVADQTGINVKTADMALQRFARRLGQARNGTGELKKVTDKYNIALSNADGTLKTTMQVFRDLSEVVRNVENANEKLLISFKAFDSEGAKVVAVMGKTADEYERIAEAAKKSLIPEASLDELNDFNNALKKLGNEGLAFVAIQFAELLHISGEFIRRMKLGAIFFGAASTGVLSGNAFVTGMEAIERELLRAKLEDAKKKAAKDTTADGTPKDPDVAGETTTGQEALAFARLAAKISELRRKFISQSKSLKTAREDRSKFTLSELAQSNVRFTGTLSREQMVARQVVQLEAMAERNQQLGFGDLSQQQFSHAENLRKGLTNVVERDRFLFKSLEQAANGTFMKMIDLVDMFHNGEAEVTARNAP